MSLADIFFYYVSSGVLTSIIMFCYEGIRYDEKITNHIDTIGIVTTGLFWPVYGIKYGLRLLVTVLNRLLYDIIHW